MEAALLELFATATRARIIPADRLERGNKRLGRVWSRPTDILTTDGVPLLFSVGCIRESRRPGGLGIGQTAPEGLADSIGDSLKQALACKTGCPLFARSLVDWVPIATAAKIFRASY